MVLLAASPAWAREVFPGVIQDKLRMDCPPPCTICHTSPNGGSDTVEQPFVNNLLAFNMGVTEANLPSLLDLAETAACPNAADKACVGVPTCGPCNVDGKGKGDVADLREGINPNTGVELACPKYGCGASSIAPERRTRPIDGTTALLALVAAGVFVRRARRG